MQFFIDEDLSPALAKECQRAGYDATSSRDRAMLGATDHVIAALCLDEERVLVTNNAGDFFGLTKEATLHPGLIVMPLGSRAQERLWMKAAIAAVERRASRTGETTSESMINAVIEVDEEGICQHFDYP